MPQSGKKDAWKTCLWDSSFPSLLSQDSPGEWVNSRPVEEGCNAILGSVALSYRALTMDQALYLHGPSAFNPHFEVDTLSILPFGGNEAQRGQVIFPRSHSQIPEETGI